MKKSKEMKENSPSVKNKGGRPRTSVEERIKEKSFNLRIIKRLAFYGLTDQELADILEVDEATINRWKQDPKFLQALKKGKLEADNKVERRLYERACGFSHPEEKVFCSEGSIVTHKTTKHYPPDAVAAIFWLKNRRRNIWKDKQEVEFVKPLEIVVKDYRGQSSEIQENTDKSDNKV